MKKYGLLIVAAIAAILVALWIIGMIPVPILY